MVSSNIDSYTIARVGLHHFEEPCISGTQGSGTVFFSGCNLGCLFCQNYEISREKKGLTISEDGLIYAFKYLEDLGANNINLVTPALWTTKLIKTLEKAKSRINIPILWNSSGYETISNLKKLDGLIDIYLPDFKYSNNSLAWEYSRAKNYFDIAIPAITEMRRQQPKDIFKNDLMKQGVIVRHLVLPNEIENTKGVLKAISSIDPNLYVSLMCQYFPTINVMNHPKLNRKLTEEEYNQAIDAFFDAGLSNGFSQELNSATEEYVPDFDLTSLKTLLKKFII